MNEGLIARRYAKALLKYAQEKDKTFPVYEAARQVEASFIAHPDLQEAMLNPVLTASQKEALMLSAAGVDAASSEEYLRFVRAASERAQGGLFTSYHAHVSEVVSGRQSYCQSPNRNGCSSRQTNPFSYRRGRCPSLQRSKTGI